MIRGIISIALLAIAVSGCTSPESGPDDVGTATLAVTLPDGTTINTVHYQVTGNGQNLAGDVDVSGTGTTVSFALDGIPAATGYQLDLTATTSSNASCHGTAPFAVVAGGTSFVSIVLQCQLPDGTGGGVVVDGGFNYCPQITSHSVTPLSVSVGSTIAVASAATDADGHPLAYAWTATAGSFANPAAATTTYLCTAAGTPTLTITVDDGHGCTDSESVQVTCVAVPVPAACGDGTVDPGEQCDDGNTTAGDGCSPTCHTEVCGNGVLDPGEECDDGNQVPDDACSNTCTAITACEACEADNCHNYFDSDVIAECYNATGVATGGPAAGQPKAALCVAFLECAYTNHCALNGAEECYCGAGVPINTCLTQGGSGVCKAQAEAAAESTAALTIAERFVDPAFAIGNAARLLRCDQEFCASDCL